MKVYLNTTIDEKDIDKKTFEKIFKEIENLGYEHVDADAIQHSNLHSLTSQEEVVKEYNHILNYIRKADICIFETSSLSFITGFLINTSLDQQKPTIVLHSKDFKPYFLSGVTHEKLMIQEYSEKSIKKSIQQALDQAREKRDKRFNFFISPKLLEFLESASTTEGITKSKFIRNLIVEHMRENQNS